MWGSFYTHRIDGTNGIFTYIYHTNQPNVGLHTIHVDPMGICNRSLGMDLQKNHPVGRKDPRNPCSHTTQGIHGLGPAVFGSSWVGGWGSEALWPCGSLGFPLIFMWSSQICGRIFTCLRPEEKMGSENQEEGQKISLNSGICT